MENVEFVMNEIIKIVKNVESISRIQDCADCQHSVDSERNPDMDNSVCGDCCKGYGFGDKFTISDKCCKEKVNQIYELINGGVKNDLQ